MNGMIGHDWSTDCTIEEFENWLGIVFKGPGWYPAPVDRELDSDKSDWCLVESTGPDTVRMTVWNDRDPRAALEDAARAVVLEITTKGEVR